MKELVKPTKLEEQLQSTELYAECGINGCGTNTKDCGYNDCSVNYADTVDDDIIF